jgi:hypothetical protein
MEYLARTAFGDGLAKLSLRFKLPKTDTLEAYYQYLCRRFSDEQFIETCSILFATSRRFPIPHDFVESAPPRVAAFRVDPDIAPSDNPFQPAIIRVKKGTQAHRAWREQFEARERVGTVETRPKRWIEEGYPAPEVVFVD